MSRSKNQARLVKLKDGRTGILFNSDCKALNNGKVPVYVTRDPPPNLFGDLPSLKDFRKAGTDKVLCDPAGLQVLAYID